MLSMSWVIASLLIYQPPDTPVDNDTVLSVRGEIVFILLAEQLIDEREIWYWGLSRAGGRDCAVNDLNIARNRRVLLLGAPLVEDVYRFPSRTTAMSYKSVNRQIRQYAELMEMCQKHHETEWMVVIHELDALYELWDHVEDARCDYYYVTVRREKLKWLLDKLGPEDYYSTNLPPCAPYWRFAAE